MKIRNLLIPLLLVCWTEHARAAEAQVPMQPSHVYMNGHQLMVQKRLSDGTLDVARPYVIKGVNWQAATASPATGPDPTLGGALVPYGCFFDDSPGNPFRSPGLEGHDLFRLWAKSELVAHASVDIPLIHQMNANTVRVFSDFGSNAATTKQILDTLYQNDIMVIMTVVTTSSDIKTAAYLTSVQGAMNHPAILMWGIGDEWNANGYFNTYPTMNAAVADTQAAAAQIKALDANHPVSSSLGDIFDPGAACPLSGSPCDVPAIVAAVTNVDLWGLNIYRGPTFTTLFQQWTALSTPKPFYLEEFGVDSFNTASYTLPFSTAAPTSGFLTNEAQVTAGVDDPATQASWDLGLWNAIAVQLSALDAQAPCVGGDIFEFNDEIWRVGSFIAGLGGLGDGQCNHYDPGGFLTPGVTPDSITNSEYSGLVTAERAPKASYAALQTYYQTLAAARVPTVTYFNPPSAAAGGSGFMLTLHGSNFDGDAFVYWDGAPKSATVLSASELQIPLTSADLAQAGSANVFVVNPSTMGAASPLLLFPVEASSTSSAARVSPNPWRADRHNGVPVTFDQLAPGSEVKIFTLFSPLGENAFGPFRFCDMGSKNADGDAVASGLYLYLIVDPQGEKTRGTLAVAR